LTSRKGSEVPPSIQTEQGADTLDGMVGLRHGEKPGPDQCLHRTRKARGNLLGEKGHPQAWFSNDGPFVWFQASGQNLEEGGFPFPVTAYQSDSFGALDLEGRTSQKRPIAVEDTEAPAADQSHDDRPTDFGRGLREAPHPTWAEVP
jgi:hypothetical protein